jgi:hypothetical protein
MVDNRQMQIDMFDAPAPLAPRLTPVGPGEYPTEFPGVYVRVDPPQRDGRNWGFDGPPGSTFRVVHVISRHAGGEIRG